MLVERLDGVELVGRCDSGEAGIEAMASAAPDVGAKVRVLFVSGRLQGEDAYQLVEAGAYGVIEKDATFAEIADAIQHVARGETVLSQRVQASLMAGVRERRNRAPIIPLSDRELAILKGLARGLSAPAIANELDLSASTIKSYLQRVYEKLGVSDRAAAVAEGMRRQLID